MQSSLPRRAWITVVVGFVAAFLAGALFPVWVKRSGGWQNGTAWDIATLNRVHHPLPRWLDMVMLIVPWFGTNITFFALLIPVGIWLWRRGRRDLVEELAIVSVGNYCLNMFLKLAFGRPRPVLWDPRGEYAWASYPSGHSIAVMSVLVIIAWLLHRERGYRWPFAVWLVIVVTMVYSRVYLGVHWPTDVAAGLVIGSIWGAAVWLALRGQMRGAFRLYGPSHDNSPADTPLRRR